MSGNVTESENIGVDSGESSEAFRHVVTAACAGYVEHGKCDVESAADTADSAANLRSARSERLAAFARDDEAMQQMHRIAEQHGRLPRDSLMARELVADVIGDMFTGDARYNQEREVTPQVEAHVLHRAKCLQRPYRPGGKRRAAPRPELVPLDKAPTSALMVDPFQDALDDDEGGRPDAAEVVVRIREQARDDGMVKQLLALVERRIVSGRAAPEGRMVLRRDVLGAGMTEWVYRAARERLLRYATIARSAASAALTSAQSAALTSAQSVPGADAEDALDAARPVAMGRGFVSRTGGRRAARRPRDHGRRLRI